jgi:hypothetical protein
MARFLICLGTGTQAADRHSTIQQVSLSVLVQGHRQQTGTVQYSRFPFLSWYWDTGTVQYSRFPFLSWYWDTGSRPAQYNTAGFLSWYWDTGSRPAQYNRFPILSFYRDTDRHIDRTAAFPFCHGTWDTGSRQAQRQYSRFPMPMPHAPNKKQSHLKRTAS